jgi:hypothetical protein
MSNNFDNPHSIPPKDLHWNAETNQWEPITKKAKKHTGRNIFLAIVGTFAAIAIVLTLASLGAGPGNSPTKSVAVPPQPTSQPGTPVKPHEQAPTMDCVNQKNRNEPCVVHAGKPFGLGSHAVLAGWKVIQSEYGQQFSVVGKAKNTDDHASTMFITIKFLKGTEVLGSVMCNTSALEPGQTEAINCIDDGTYGRYDTITAEAIG